MNTIDVVILFFAGMLGGATNAVAGGGTFFTFPVLMATGLDPIIANASSAVALYPAYVSAIAAYRKEIRQAGGQLWVRFAIALLGGLIGAGLLLYGGSAVFSRLVPWLLLTATLLFALGPKIREMAQATRLASFGPSMAIIFLFAIYGGYFGAGLGILLMAALTIVGVRDIQIANAQKILLGMVVNTMAVVTFVIAGVVAWPQTLVVLAGATLGGFGGAHVARHLPETVLRGVVIAVGIGLTVYYFWK